MKLRVSRWGRIGAMLACVALASLSCAFIASALEAASPPAYVPNEYIIQATANASVSAVQQSLALVGGTLVKTLPLPDTYLVRINRTGAGSGSGTPAARLYATPAPWVIRRFSPNLVCFVDATPNDLYWPKLWGMRSINMPQVWNTQKGSSSVTAAVLDTGVAHHPDLLGRVLLGYDFVDNDPDPSNDTVGHGTHVAGTIAAQGDNTIGVCGVCWDGVMILPVRIGDDNGMTLSNTLLGLEYALQQRADVVNMSFGWPHPIQVPELQAEIQKLDNAGIILCAAAGNSGMDFDPGVAQPAAFPECIAVAAIGPSDEIAPYSSYGPGYEVDVAAPGGNSFTGEDGEIWSTTVTWSGGVPTFDYGPPMQGTSMACPHVVGAVAILLSAGVPASDIRDRLVGTVRRPGISGPVDKKKYGAGILDVNAALANGSILLIKPVKGSMVNGFPDIKASVRGIDPTSIAVYIDYGDGDGNGIPDNIGTEVPILAGIPASQYLNLTETTLSFNYRDVSAVPLGAGLHFIYVSARTKVGNDEVYDWGTFTVPSKVIPAGQYLYAFPYGLTVTNPDGTTFVTALPSDLLIDATTSAPLDFRVMSADRARLIRWNAAQMYYVPYVTGTNPMFPGENVPRDDDKAWLNTIVRMMLPNGTIQAVPTAGGFLPGDVTGGLQFPAGTGFWLTLQRDAVISSTYSEISAPNFSIYLYRGWNLIGNPFTRDVPLSKIHIAYHGEIRSFDEDQDPLKRTHWLDASVYGYQSGQGYVKVPDDKRLLEPYRGYWLRANVGGISPQDSLIMTVE